MLGELDGKPRIVVEVDNGRAVCCDMLRAVSEAGTVAAEKESKEG